MKFLVTLLFSLCLLSIESVVVKYLGLTVSRIDVTVAIVAFLGLRASIVEGAFSSFAVGYLLDLMSGQPTGLYTFLAVFTFLICRLAGSLVDIRSGLSFALFATAADLGHSLLAVFFLWLTSREAAVTSLLSGLFLQLPLTGAAALCLFPLLNRIDRGRDQSEVGLLR
jgi:hypothetical protein